MLLIIKNYNKFVKYWWMKVLAKYLDTGELKDSEQW